MAFEYSAQNSNLFISYQDGNTIRKDSNDELRINLDKFIECRPFADVDMMRPQKSRFLTEFGLQLRTFNGFRTGNYGNGTLPFL